MKTYTLLILILFLCGCSTADSQTVSGTLSGHPGEEIRLEGFNGLETYLIDSGRASSDGSFSLSYTGEEPGMGLLSIENSGSFVVVLSGENIRIEGESLAFPGSLEIISGQENQWFEQYASEHPRREAVLSAWIYLRNIYEADSLFAVQDVPKEAVETEIARIRTEDSAFLEGLPSDSYVSWFLPVRKLVSSVSVIAQYRTEEIPDAITAFREMDYIDERLYKSGLFQDVIDSHMWMIENSGRELEDVFKEINISVDAMMESLSKDEQKFNEVTRYLFNLLERRSLFPSAEYLALKVLNEQPVELRTSLTNRLETYRAMKVGSTAPEIDFTGDILAPGYPAEDMPQALSDIRSEYIVVAFGSGWCPACAEEIPQIARHYNKWKEQSVEVVFVSLDEDEASFRDFAGYFPFISVSDFQKWDSPVINDYHVYETPTLFLLDRDKKIILRPNSVNQINAWVDWFLVDGNPRP